jgi:hypothetical protein
VSDVPDKGALVGRFTLDKTQTQRWHDSYAFKVELRARAREQLAKHPEIECIHIMSGGGRVLERVHRPLPTEN